MPTRGVSSEINSLKIDTFLFAKAFASFKNPLEIKLLPLSGWFIKVGLYPSLFRTVMVSFPISVS